MYTVEELTKMIDIAEKELEGEVELGCGFTPTGYIDEMSEKIGSMYEELAKLKGYENYSEMVHAEASEDDDLPF